MAQPNDIQPTHDALPLWSFFQDWQRLDREAGHRSVDIQAYQLLVEALTNGLAFGDTDTLFALCRGLLLKPHHKLQTFEEKFKALWTARPDDSQNPLGKRDDKGHTSQGNTTNPIPPTSNEGKEEEETEQPDPTGLKDEEMVKRAKPEISTQKVAVKFGALENDGTENGTDPDWEARANARPFRMEGNYEPIEARAMRQHVRQLRHQTYRNATLEVDLNATIDQVTQQGFFTGVVRKRNFHYEVPLTLLIDRRGSMLPFHHLSDQLANAVLEQPGSSVRYFQNSLEKFLFRTPFLTNPESADAYKTRLQSNALMLILSDAGAARGFYNPERIDRVRTMLKTLQTKDGKPFPLRIVWLNPMPRDRWWATSAAAIATSVSMYTLNELEMGTAIKNLNGLMITTT